MGMRVRAARERIAEPVVEEPRLDLLVHLAAREAQDLREAVERGLDRALLAELVRRIRRWPACPRDEHRSVERTRRPERRERAMWIEEHRGALSVLRPPERLAEAQRQLHHMAHREAFERAQRRRR